MLEADLNHRRTQLHLLDDACAALATARMSPLGPDGETRADCEVRFVQRVDRQLVVEPVDAATAAALTVGCRVLVRFTHGGHAYRFSADIHRVDAAPASRAAPALRLNLPLRIDRHGARRALDLRLDADPSVSARLTAIFDSANSIAARLSAVSPQGIDALVDASDLDRLPFGEPMWVDFTLPGDSRPFEFGALLRPPRRRLASDRQVPLRLDFTGGDDDAAYQGQLDRLERIAQRLASQQPGTSGKTHHVAR